MQLSVAAQEYASDAGSSRHARKRKRESSKATLDPVDFVRGTTAANSLIEVKEDSAPPQDIEGKGKARASLLGEDGVRGNRAEIGQYVSLDCEFVGLYDPENHHAQHSLARVSMVNYHGAIVLDTFVAQRERVGDWRTWVSGVRPEDVQGAPSYQTVQKQVSDLLKGRVLVGHAVHNDLKVLMLSHPGPDIRDTSKYGPLRELARTKRPSLKALASKALGIDIQQGEHSSVTDARATMAIYRTVQKEWEAKIRSAKGGKHRPDKRLKPAEDKAGGAIGPDGKAVRKQGGARVKGGPGGMSRNGSLGLAATLKREKDWWSSGTLDT